MTTTLSVRLDVETKDCLEELAKRSRRSPSFLVSEAIAAFVEIEYWQLNQIQTSLEELDNGQVVGHTGVAAWLRSWGKSRERKPPRR